MFGATQRILAIVVALVAAGPMMPSVSMAGPRESTLSCELIKDPVALSSLDLEDFLILMTKCPGAIERVKSKDSRLIVEAPGVDKRERKEDVKVRVARRGATAVTRPSAPDPRDLDALTEAGFEVKQENETVVREINDSRYEKREENTSAEGRDFDYELEDSRESTDEPGFHSEERESEEKLDTR